jgi:FSR family fosmidomycin resistance protein-like MFS transporter
VAAAGLVTTFAAFFVPLDLVWLPVALAGLGNALFHVGAGALALGATRFRASGPGLFVAPGALGVGVMMGPAIPRGAEWTLMSILALFLLAMPLLPDGESKRAELAAGAFRPAGAWWVLILLLAAIGLRSLVGLRIGDRAGSFAGGALALAAAAVAGKALGGIVADRLGWIRTVVPALIVSAAMLACEGLWPAIAAVLLFQAVTGVTLAALFRVLPDRPASAFGLGSLALFAGALPVLLNVDLSPLGRSHLDALFGIVAALCVLGALALLRRNEGLSRTLP